MDARERLTELLARRATAGLDQDESRELQGLLASHPEWDNDSFDRAAAALDLGIGPDEGLPPEVRQRLEESATRHAARRAAAEEPEEPASTDGGEPAPEASGAASVMRRTGMPPWTGWLAAAAALAIALFAWWPRAQTPPADAEMRSRLIDEAEDLVQVAWTATDDPAVQDAGGDVVWSSERQRGYLLIRGLRPNDPEVARYQLWVFDARRDPRFPVDGGVFDIPRGRDHVVVPIDNKLPVAEPTRFSVTVEPPGGVVVSDRDRVVLVADVADG